ncbi:hypothetical protein [Bacillus velezensis]|uniref:hypothetical protein n=1 Tax=Bacillus velezensis TaxID=492670 RepID=UPI001A91BCC2|nr:hypothetical protein [Bacillus velezensis]BCT30337.1 hypothetical protein BVAD3_40110 [Bacillus velezensis]
MAYELVLVPKSYTEHKDPRTEGSNCVMCNEEKLELIEEFLNIAGIPTGKTDFEGLFSLCPGCNTAHLELVSGDVDFTGPVLIGWE